MSLHPDLDAFLTLARDKGHPPFHTLSVEKARALYDRTATQLDAPSQVATSALQFTARDGVQIPVRRHDPGETRAALLYFHGGGYTVGGLDSHDGLCGALAALTPCVVFAVDYRLAPEHRFPTAFEDSEDSYQWLLAHSASLGIDASRIAVAGDSAGGTLATTLCLSARDHGWPLPCAQALLYPCTSARQDSASHQRYDTGYLLEQQTLQWMFGHYLRDERDRNDWRFSPLNAGSLTDLPPTFIGLAEHDPLVDEGIAYAGRLTTAGVDTRLEIYDGMVHDFARLMQVVPDAARQVREDMAEMLAECLGG
ncbi:lipolytic protein [Isoalcanivorax pacificus W11-5]|uniref:Lipolytic protein n=1 Tax=Isoalcanivorax pacificus W11-5 TaxID=391936 RepID=A0A0B4XLT8_9GAMM|nr:alpha/beta hydrolase [Isoalcanivorax pacificus]AJD47498.1 lipolytic protein [Isoalcanivorax pacificus W11-5]